jgi:hypothetical protein
LSSSKLKLLASALMKKRSKRKSPREQEALLRDLQARDRISILISDSEPLNAAHR